MFSFEKIPKMVLNRNVTVLMSLIAIIVIGMIVLTKIKLEFMPQGITSPYMGTYIPYANSTPEEVEKLIVDKVGPEYNTIYGIKRVEANISANGVFFFLQFNSDVNLDEAYLDMVDRLERLRHELPDESQRYWVRRFGPGGDSEFDIFFIGRKNTGNEYNFIKNFIVKRFERIDGVAQIDFDASGEKSIYIYVNNDLVKAYNVNLAQVIGKLRSDNFMMSSGYVEEGNHKIFVRSKSKINNLDQLANLVINESGLRLKDIATVEYTTGDREWFWRINGLPGMDIEITKEPLANTVEVTDKIAAEVEALNKHPRVVAEGIELQPIFNQGKYIKQSVFNLIESGLWGGLFAFIFIYAFLRRFRMTSIITMAIPISILMSIINLYFFDQSLNGMTLMGLLIAVGLVVDNAIVIVENIYRKRQEGMEVNQAAIKGTSEVGLAITLSTLTTVAIFVPIFMMPSMGMIGFFRAIAFPVVGALIASLIVAIIYIPYTSTRVSSKKEVVEPEWIKKLSTIISSITMYFVKNRMTAFIVVIVLFGFYFAGPSPRNEGMNDGNINDFRIMVDLPDNYTIEQTMNIVDDLEAYAEEKKEEYKIRSYLSNGRKGWIRFKVFLEEKEVPPWYKSVYKNLHNGLASVGVIDSLDLPITREEAQERFKKIIPDAPGIRIRSNWRDAGFMKADASVTVQLEGDDTKRLLTIAEEMKRRLKTIDVVTRTDINIENGQDEVQVKLDRVKMRKYNVDASTVRSLIDFTIRGVRFRNFQNERGEEIGVQIKSRKEDRETLDQLKALTIFTNDGKQVPLAAIADFNVERGLGSIRQINGKTVMQVKAITDSEENVEKIKGQLNSVLSGLDMPFGYKWGLGRIAQQEEEQDAELLSTMLMGGILIYLLMGVLFESFILPLSIIVSVPFAFIGSKILFLVTDTAMDLMAGIGQVVLIGIVVNNGIVLIDAINRYRKMGYSRDDAIRIASKNRVRPIILTGITTIGGMLPMALGETEFIGIKYAPMGRMIVGGLLSSTFLTLMLTPFIYTAFDNMRNRFMRVMESMFNDGYFGKNSGSIAQPELRNKID
jgi:HAE1 family hydrophobic/amphiphilic exporter-1